MLVHAHTCQWTHTVHAHLLYMHTYYTCTPCAHLTPVASSRTHVSMDTYCTCTHTVHAHLLYMHTYCTCTPTIHAHLLYMHTYYPGGNEGADVYTHVSVDTYYIWTSTALGYLLHMDTWYMCSNIHTHTIYGHLLYVHTMYEHLLYMD